MSSIVPGGPSKKLEEEIAAARSGARPLDSGSLDVPSLQKTDVVGIENWPPVLQRLVEHDARRTTALAGNRRQTADAALQDVVRSLNELLDLAAETVRSAGRGLRALTEGSPESEFLTSLPLDEVAELLGIPSDEVAQPAALVTRSTLQSRADRRTALRGVKQLRAQLQEIESAKSHPRLTRQVNFVLRLTLVLDAAVGETSAAALTPTTSDLAALIPTAVVTLVTNALDHATNPVQDAWRDQDATALATQTHAALLDALSTADGLTTSESPEPTAIAFGLLVASARSWIAHYQLDTDFPQKLAYWLTLDELPDVLESPTPQAVQDLHDDLRAFTPPAP